MSRIEASLSFLRNSISSMYPTPEGAAGFTQAARAIPCGEPYERTCASSEERALGRLPHRGRRPFRGQQERPARLRAPASAHQPSQPIRLLPPDVRAPPVKLLVPLEQIGTVGAQPVKEDVAHLAAQVQRNAADVRPAGFARQ